MAEATKQQVNKEHGKAGQTVPPASNGKPKQSLGNADLDAAAKRLADAGLIVRKKSKRKGGPVDPNETPAARFVRLAKARTPLAIKRIASITALFRGAGYEWTPDQAAKVKAALEKAMNAFYASLEPREKKAADEFAL